MNRVSKMMLMASGRNRRNPEPEYRYIEPHYIMPRYEYDVDDRYRMDDRFRDRRGREHYDNGRYAPSNNMGDYDAESRTRRDRIDWDDSYPSYENGAEGRYTGGNIYPMSSYHQENSPKRKIGFSIGGEMERIPESRMTRGVSREQLTRKTAEEWVSHMQNSDGTTGQHWSVEQAQQLMAQRKINCDPIRFYTALNAVYSDFGGVAKKHGVSNVEFFADLAKAWLDDRDAVSDKLEAYYENVVKH